MSIPQSRAHAPGVAGVLAVPLLLGAALLAVASVSILVVATVDASASQALVEAVIALAVVPVSAAAAWLGWRVGRERAVAAWLLFVPTLLAVGILALSSIPIMGEALGEARMAVAVATVLWCLLLTGLAIVGRRLTSRLAWPAAALVMAVAGLAILDFTFVAYAGLGTSANAAPSYWWYPSALTTYSFGMPGAASDLSEDLKALPALLTTCTAFTLSLARSTGRRAEHVHPNDAS